VIPTEVISAVLLLIGVLFMLIAAFGVLRMPDIFLRMSASTKAATLGVGGVLLAAAVHFRELGIASRAIAIIVFALLTVPVAAHMIGRAAYRNRVGLWSGTVLDELEGKYDALTGELEGSPPRRSPALPALALDRVDAHRLDGGSRDTTV
jgi:multicomponent Na+:H+ antiporter subunit G